jgi:hypothetical protein
MSDRQCAHYDFEGCAFCALEAQAAKDKAALDECGRLLGLITVLGTLRPTEELASTETHCSVQAMLAVLRERDEALAQMRDVLACNEEDVDGLTALIAQARAQSAERGEVIRLLLRWHEEHGIGSIKLCARARAAIGDK